MKNITLEDKVDKLDNKVDRLDNKLDKLIDGLNSKFDSIDKKFDEVNKRFNKVDKEADRRFDLLMEEIGKVSSKVTEHDGTLKYNESFMGNLEMRVNDLEKVKK